MKIDFLLEHLQTSIQHLVRTASKSSTLPSLQGIFLETKGNKLILTTTNLDIGLTVSVPVKTEKEGSVLVSADVFGKIIANLPNTEKKVTLYTEGDIVNITTEKTNITLTTLPKEEFPKLPTVTGTVLQLQKDILIDGIKNVVFATATTDIKPEIAAVYIYTEPGQIVFVGTDSFRLAEKKIKIKNSEEIKVLIPNKNALEILKILELAPDSITLTYSNTMLTIEGKDVYLTTRVVDGVFPEYRRIIPSEVNTETKVLKQDLINIFKVTNFFSDTFNQITFSIKEDVLTCSTKNQHVGTVEYSIPSKTTGRNIEMNFNYRYIQEVLTNLSKDSITLSCMNEQKAMVLRPTGDDSFLYLTMPLNR